MLFPTGVIGNLRLEAQRDWISPPAMPLRQRLLPTKHTGQVWWTSSRQQQRQTDPEKTERHRICAGPSLESSHRKRQEPVLKDAASVSAGRGLISLRFLCQPVISVLEKRETNQHKPFTLTHLPHYVLHKCTKLVMIHWTTGSPGPSQHKFSGFLLKFEFNKWFWNNSKNISVI